MWRELCISFGPDIIFIAFTPNAFSLNPMTLGRPITKINHLAALAAKRAVGIVFGHKYFGLADRATNSKCLYSHDSDLFEANIK